MDFNNIIEKLNYNINAPILYKTTRIYKYKKVTLFFLMHVKSKMVFHSFI